MVEAVPQIRSALLARAWAVVPATFTACVVYSICCSWPPLKRQMSCRCKKDSVMKRKPLTWSTLLWLALVALSVQGCLGIGGKSNNGKAVTTGSGGSQVSLIQDVFKANFYLPIS